MKNSHHLIVSTLLLLLGLGLFAYKVVWLRFPLTVDTESSLWTVEANLTFVPKRGAAAKVSLSVPRSDRNTLIMDENFVSRGFGLTMAQSGFNRKATWAIRRASGQQRLFYRAVVRKLGSSEVGVELPPAKMRKKHFLDARLEAAKSIIDETQRTSADTETFVQGLLHRINSAKQGGNMALLLEKSRSKEAKLNLAAELLQEAGISARTVRGIRLHQEIKNVQLENWLEIYENKRWRVFGRAKSLDAGVEPEYLVWTRGSDPLVELTGGGSLQVRLSVARSQEGAIESALIAAESINRPFFDYSLFALPIQTQSVYRILLTIPLGALMIALLRSVVGVRTFGTFLPVLVAVSFRETQLLNGIILFSLTVSLGLIVRLYFEHLKLLLVPRLASVLIVVIICMIMLSLITYRLGLPTGLSIALFPVIILTLTIERMSVIWEEVGPLESFKQGIGTLIASSLVYLVLSQPQVEHLMFVFPELVFVLLAMTISLGRYKGYRLLELNRFRALTSKPV